MTRRQSLSSLRQLITDSVMIIGGNGKTSGTITIAGGIVDSKIEKITMWQRATAAFCRTGLK